MDDILLCLSTVSKDQTEFASEVAVKEDQEREEYMRHAGV